MDGFAYAVEKGGALRELWRMELGSNWVLFLADDGEHLAMLEPHEWGVSYSPDFEGGFQKREDDALIFSEKGRRIRAYKASELFDTQASWAQSPNDLWWVAHDWDRLPWQTSGFRFEVETPDGVTHEFDLCTGERRSSGSEMERLRNRLIVGNLFSALDRYAHSAAGVSVVLGPFKYNSASSSGSAPGECQDIGVFRRPRVVSAGVVQCAPDILIKVWHRADHERIAGLAAASSFENGATEYWDIDSETAVLRVYVRDKGYEQPVATLGGNSKFGSELLPGLELNWASILDGTTVPAR